MTTTTSISERPVQTQTQRHGRGCLERGLLVVIVLIIALPVVGWVYQQAAEANDRQVYPPPGQRIDVGGFDLHILCSGEGSPTVILEAGTGESSLDWSLVQPSIAAQTRVCAYDREGYGWSDDGTHARSSSQIVADLHTLLSSAHIDPPYVLVGHSVGVLHNQAYIGQYPDEVVGVVMVDSPIADYYLSEGLSDNDIAFQSIGVNAAQLAMMRFLSTVGVVRVTNFAMSVDPVAAELPVDLQPAYLALLNQSRYFASLREDWADYAGNLRDAMALPPFSSDLPLVILTRDWAIASDPTAVMFRDDQLAYASRWPKAPIRIAEGSNHFIMIQRPDVVIQAVQDVVEAVRTGNALVHKEVLGGMDAILPLQQSTNCKWSKKDHEYDCNNQ